MLDFGDAFIIVCKTLVVLMVIDLVLVLFVWGATKWTKENDQLVEDYNKKLERKPNGEEEMNRLYGAPW